ncbi:hypothetical protein KKE60_08155 [Patescibacteria group bacterium]|nr:hypothetical protein [Patescibacteria group bacterium]
MIIKIRIAHWRFTWTFAPVTDVTGVNSTLPDGRHIPMWDFDDIPLHDVAYELHGVQQAGFLSNIYILQTGKKDHYIAYCFKAQTWTLSKMTVCAARSVDANFFKYGVYRGHWTLRVTPKEGRKPKLVAILHSPIPEDTSIDELNSWVKDTPLKQRSFLIFPLHSIPMHSYPHTCPPKIRNARRCYTNEEV